MAETYKSQGTTIANTTATTIYTAPSAPGTYALVNSINIANASTTGSNVVSVEILKSGTTPYYLINGAQIPVGTSLQLLDSTLVLQNTDTLRLTSGYAFGIHSVVSVLEIT